MSNQLQLSRRQFMVGCSAAIAAMAGSRISQMAIAAPDGPNANTYESVIVVFLRGGLDGLNAVLPIGGVDRGNYETWRPTLKVPVSGGLNGNAINLGTANTLNGTTFGLHPGLAAFKELYDAGALAIVHAAGLVDDTRSHFDAMQFMETATPGLKTTSTGWLTRHLNTAPNITGPVFMPALSAGSSPAMSLLGREDLVTMNGATGFDIGESWNTTGTGQRKTVLRRMYAGQSWLQVAGRETLDAFDVVESALKSYTPSPGANYQQYNGFHDQLKTIAQIVKANLGLRTATIDYGGWDTHESQQFGNNDPRGQYFNNLDTISRGLQAFYNDLAATGHHTRATVVVMSEFGRRVRENGNIGTDHGHGNVMFVLGGSVNGRKVFGNWPGLSNAQLYDQADLAITTDYRTVLAEILTKRAGNPNITGANGVFPGYTHPGDLGIVR